MIKRSKKNPSINSSNCKPLYCNLGCKSLNCEKLSSIVILKLDSNAGIVIRAKTNHST